MRTKRYPALITALLLVALALNASAAAGDPHSGTWKMNPAKSKYSPGPAPRSVTLKIDSDGDNVKFASDEVDAAGRTTHVRYTAKLDAEDYPITGVPYADTIAFGPLDDPNMTWAALKKSGEIVMSVKSTVSKDGKTRTTTFAGKDERGREVSDVVVYDKQ